jgi:hypothetical protein
LELARTLLIAGAFTEDNFFTHSKEGQFDQTFFGTAHETAHHWWGGQVHGAGGGRGEGMLSESLANYSAMMVTEKTFGLQAARQVYAFQLDRYLRQRANVSRDVPSTALASRKPVPPLATRCQSRFRTQTIQ